MAIKVYKYGLLEPTMGADLVWGQIRLAHHYYNDLVTNERNRREAIADILRRWGLESLEAEVEKVKQKLLDAISEMKQERIRERSRKSSVSPLIKELKANLSRAREVLRNQRKQLASDPMVQAELLEAQAAAVSKQKELRSKCGVYWGTYQKVEQALDATRRTASPPHYHRWMNGGSVAVQIINGMRVEDLEADTRAQLLPLQEVPGRKGKWRQRLRLRVGSNQDRTPIWAEWPIILHRPLPPEGVITGVKVTARRVGSHVEWAAHFTVSLPEMPSVTKRSMSRVAIDLHWKRDEDKQVVSALWRGDDGRQGKVIVPPMSLLQLEKSSDIRSIRDRLLLGKDGIRDQLVAWRNADKPIPEDLREKVANVGQWKAQGRFAHLTLLWRERRIPGDEEIYMRLEDWRKRDRHLWDYESNARRKAISRRKDAYRVIARGLEREYGLAVLEKINLAKLARAPGEETEEWDVGATRHPKGKDGEALGVQRGSRWQQGAAAPGELRTAIEQAFGKARVRYLPAGLPLSTMLDLEGEIKVDERSEEEIEATNRFARASARATRKKNQSPGEVSATETHNACSTAL